MAVVTVMLGNNHLMLNMDLEETEEATICMFNNDETFLTSPQLQIQSISNVTKNRSYLVQPRSQWKSHSSLLICPDQLRFNSKAVFFQDLKKKKRICQMASTANDTINNPIIHACIQTAHPDLMNVNNE